MNDVAGQPDFPGVRDHGAAERLDQRRLARAVVADDGEDLAGVEIEIGVVERRDAAVSLDERTRLQDGFDAHLETLRIH